MDGGSAAKAKGKAVYAIGFNHFQQASVNPRVAAAVPSWCATFALDSCGAVVEVGWRHRTLTHGCEHLACAWNRLFCSRPDGKLLVLQGLQQLPMGDLHTQVLTIGCPISSVAGTSTAVLCSTADGRVFCAGDLSALVDASDVPLRLKLLHLPVPIAQVACGKSHVLFRAEDGAVLSAGANSHGQLGHGSTDPAATPRYIEVLQGLHVRSLACGGWHSLFLLDGGDVFSCGRNHFGQLGKCQVEGTSLKKVVDMQTVALGFG